VDELPGAVPGGSADMFRNIDTNLRVLVNQMQKNNQAMAALLREQKKKEPDADLKQTSDRS